MPERTGAAQVVNHFTYPLRTAAAPDGQRAEAAGNASRYNTHPKPLGRHHAPAAAIPRSREPTRSRRDTVFPGGATVNEGWLALVACIVVVLSGALPLLRDRRRGTPPPPRKETLRDWRDGR